MTRAWRELDIPTGCIAEICTRAHLTAEGFDASAVRGEFLLTLRHPDADEMPMWCRSVDLLREAVESFKPVRLDFRVAAGEDAELICARMTNSLH